ncbi:MAG: nitroreductase/quinone reductase family protein [Pseudomonadales bacterium]
MDFQDFNRSVIEEFRANQGVVAGRIVGDHLAEAPLLLLHTVGAKTGETRINPLAYLADNERFIVFASYAGASSNPPWYYNLITNPSVVVEVGTERFDATASVLDEPERTSLYRTMAERLPMFADYESKTPRVIPAIALTR